MILAFDPGVTTGWAKYDWYDESYQVGQLDDSLAGIYEFLQDFKPDVVVYENFKHRNQIISAELYSVQVIGVIRLWCEKHDVDDTNKFLPGFTKPFWTDAKIKKLTLWAKGQPHAMDAMRVLLAYRASTDKLWLNQALQSIRQC